MRGRVQGEVLVVGLRLSGTALQDACVCLVSLWSSLVPRPIFSRAPCGLVDWTLSLRKLVLVTYGSQ